MANLIVVAPLPVGAIAASRGSGVDNLTSADPAEAWVDGAGAGAATLQIDLGAARTIDTILLGHCLPLAPTATWTITGGVAGYGEVTLLAEEAMRVPDSASGAPSRSHALWYGQPATVRYLSIGIEQADGFDPMSVGSMVIGRAISSAFNKEWGSGRNVIDTGRASPLANGGFAIDPGVRKGGYSWSLGDLSDAEVDALFELQLEVGQTSPVLVVEDPARSVGLIHRIHYARFSALKSYKRRNAAQTRWEFEIEQWGVA